MGKRKKSSSDVDLPGDLVAFLDETDPIDEMECPFAPGRRLWYDAATCAVSRMWLRRSEDLALERFPVHTDLSPFASRDPHFPATGSYLVLGIDLVGAAVSPYDEVGIILWLPVERRYAVWSAYDDGIQIILMFGPEVTWRQIAENPARYINAGWPAFYPDTAPTEELVPWVSHQYTTERLTKPQPAEPGAAADGGGT